MSETRRPTAQQPVSPASIFLPVVAGILRTLRGIKARFRREPALGPVCISQPDELHPAGRDLDILKSRLLRCDVQRLTASGNAAPLSRQQLDRIEGRDWPDEGETMIGLRRLDNIEMCIRNVVADGIPGDLIECGVWRGGATIFMRAALNTFGNTDKQVWVADSFQGLPKPDPKNYPADSGDLSSWFGELAVSVEQVKANFARYGLLDDRVRFLEGWFKDTLPNAPIEQLSVLRLDGDLYESTMQGLQYLYPKLAPGGYVIIDDFGAIDACAQAVTDYRGRNGITEDIRQIDWTGVYWRKEH